MAFRRSGVPVPWRSRTPAACCRQPIIVVCSFANVIGLFVLRARIHSLHLLLVTIDGIGKTSLSHGLPAPAPVVDTPKSD